MELLKGLLIYVVTPWVLSFFILTLIKRSKLNPERLPPGPFPLPIVGNLFSLGSQPHKSIGKLAESYGPVMSLQLGWQTVIVISSTSMAKEVLQTHDASFANRHVPDAFTASEHHEFSVVLRPADALWRTYRKVCISQVFTNSRLDATHALREKSVKQLLSHIQSYCESGKPVNVAQAIFTTSLNFLSNTFFSIDLGTSTTDLAIEFKRHITSLSVEGGTPNMADAFPVLKVVDPQGIKKRTAVAIEQMFKVFNMIIKERLETRKSSSSSPSSYEDKDVLDALLTMTQQSEEFQRKDLHHFFLDLFSGTDSTSSSIEWAMTELLRNPEKMKRVQTELEKVIGKGNALKEKDSSRLPYLQAVMKETFRLHPPVPFLMPRKVLSKDISLSGFQIPKNAQVLVNIYAMGRNPNIWPNPDSFEPERFLESSLDFKGQDFELIPFGSGRRICPGLPLANRLLPWMLGSLIHSFDWKLEDGLTPETINMEEKFGVSLHKAKSLYAIPLPK